MTGRAARLVLSLLAACPVVLGARDAAAQRAASHEEINLAVGETKTLSAVGVTQYSEGVKGIIDVVATADGKTFVLTARKPGTTTLLLLRGDGGQLTYDITVAQRPIGIVEKELEKLLEPFPSVKMRRVGGRVFVDGSVPSEADLKRLQQIVGIYGGQVESLVSVGVSERRLLIRLDFFFVQYEKSSGYNVGVAWPGQIGGNNVFQTSFQYDFISRTTTSATAQVVNQPLPRLDIAARYGWAKIMRHSSVITGNGSEATFQNGGETNFVQNAGLSVGLVSVKFGTNVTVLPRYDSNSRDVEIRVVADVADLTEAAVAGGPPGRTTTKLDTSVTLKLGQALILSGIRNSSQRRTTTGLPGLTQIPILGALFGSTAQDKLDTEGAVFIVPSIVDTVPRSALDLIKNAMATYSDYSGKIDAVDNYPKQPPSAK